MQLSIVRAIKQDAVCSFTITSGASCFLIILLQRPRHRPMNDISDAGFINSHSKRIGRNNQIESIRGYRRRTDRAPVYAQNLRVLRDKNQRGAHASLDTARSPPSPAAGQRTQSPCPLAVCKCSSRSEYFSTSTGGCLSKTGYFLASPETSCKR